MAIIFTTPVALINNLIILTILIMRLLLIMRRLQENAESNFSWNAKNAQEPLSRIAPLAKMEQDGDDDHDHDDRDHEDCDIYTEQIFQN